MRRPVSVKYVLSFFFLLLYFFFFISSSSKLFPWSQAASVATLPSALLVERWSFVCKLGVLDSLGAAT
jgi:hypothetical protein